MGYDGKYGRVTTEHGDIGEDEPVFVFRAQDKLLPKLLGRYYRLCSEAGSPERHLKGIIDAIDRVKLWQQENFTKIPESASEAGMTYKERRR